jgi:hypothetical protein
LCDLLQPGVAWYGLVSYCVATQGDTEMTSEKMTPEQVTNRTMTNRKTTLQVKARNLLLLPALA